MRHLTPDLKRDLSRSLDKLGAALRDYRDHVSQRGAGAMTAPVAMRSAPAFRPLGFETKDRRHDGMPTFNGTPNCFGQQRQTGQRGAA